MRLTKFDIYQGEVASKCSKRKTLDGLIFFLKKSFA